MCHVEMIVMFVIAHGFDIVIKNRAGSNGHLVAQIRTCLIESYRIEGSQHSDIGNDGDIVLRMAVAVRRYITNK